ncbi:MAG: hypothetical protein K8S97_00920 [Anaerolineae bacterium]|nr:hypothetical protein [Anaerolineae bacterium]
MTDTRVIIDPQHLDQTMQQMESAYSHLSAANLKILRRIIAQFPRATQMHVDTTQAELVSDLPLLDKFTFDVDTDELVLLADDSETLINALIEMAMYLTGFATKLGNSDAWVIEFTIGAWKPVRKRIKRRLNIPIVDVPRGLVGMPPPPDDAPAHDPYPFRTLVSHFDQVSFVQMIRLAARNDVQVYFPPGSHPKVRAIYLHTRKALQDVGQWIDLDDHQRFNANLNHAIRRIEQLFDPASLQPPTWLHDLAQESQPPNTISPDSPPELSADSPFTAFIEQLFEDEEDDSTSASE